MNFTPRRIAWTAFFVGLLPLILTPVAMIFGYTHILEFTGVLYGGVADTRQALGFGSVLYLLSLPIWIGYIWAAGGKRTEMNLRPFWITSAGINAIWVIFFVITMVRPEDQNPPASVWVAYILFPMILCVISLLGIRVISGMRPPDEPS